MVANFIPLTQLRLSSRCSLRLRSPLPEGEGSLAARAVACGHLASLRKGSQEVLHRPTVTSPWGEVDALLGASGEGRP